MNIARCIRHKVYGLRIDDLLNEFSNRRTIVKCCIGFEKLTMHVHFFKVCTQLAVIELTVQVIGIVVVREGIMQPGSRKQNPEEYKKQANRCVFFKRLHAK